MARKFRLPTLQRLRAQRRSALAWLLGLFALGGAFFALLPVYCDKPLSPDVAAGLSAANLIALPPFKPSKDIAEHLSPLAKIVGDLQAILGVVLLFLLRLGLRNRRRMK